MSAPVTVPPPRRRLPTAVVLVVQTLALPVLVVAAGLLAGLVWFHLWTPPTGVVSQGQFFVDSETGLRAEFAGTALYVLVAVVTGLLVGLLSGLLLARWELWSLLLLAVSAALAGWLMHQVGHHLSAPDPDRLARSAPDGTRLPGDLGLAGRSPYVALPLGAVVGYVAVLLLWPRRARDATAGPTEPPAPGEAPPQPLGDQAPSRPAGG